MKLKDWKLRFEIDELRLPDLPIIGELPLGVEVADVFVNWDAPVPVCDCGKHAEFFSVDYLGRYVVVEYYICRNCNAILVQNKMWKADVNGKKLWIRKVDSNEKAR